MTSAASFGFVLSAVIIGVSFGFVLQRGRFCMNTAFRETIYSKDFTLLHAYLLALVIMIVSANFLEDIGVLTLRRQSFYPLANIIGGYIFGLGIVLAGGCGSAIIYKTGEGQLAAWFAVFGFFIGISATTDGILSPVLELLKNEETKLSISGLQNPALWEIFGNNMSIKWAVITVIFLLAGLFILKSRPFTIGKQRGFYWSLTGLLVGLIGVIGFWASQYWGGSYARGISFTNPTSELFFTVLTGNSNSKIFPMHGIGPFKITWSALFIIGVPAGSYISARILREFSWNITPAKDLLTVFAGSLMMGFGAVLAGGCNIGQALTGFATLSVGSIVATIFIILGNWTMVYFKFMQPMK